MSNGFPQNTYNCRPWYPTEITQFDAIEDQLAPYGTIWVDEQHIHSKLFTQYGSLAFSIATDGSVSIPDLLTGGFVVAAAGTGKLSVVDINNYGFVSLQQSTPGTQQTGSFNVSGNGIIGTLNIGSGEYGTNFLEPVGSIVFTPISHKLGLEYYPSANWLATMKLFSIYGTITNSAISHYASQLAISNGAIMIDGDYDWIYENKTENPATLYLQDGLSHKFYSAVEGVNDANITWLGLASFANTGIAFNSEKALTSGLFSVSGKTTDNLFSIDFDTEQVTAEQNFVCNGYLGCNTGATALDAPLHVIGTTHFGGAIYTWPGADGTVGQSLTTNGAGQLIWATVAGGGTSTDHGALTGLGDDDHTQYALLAGRSTGQVLYGGINANEDLTLTGTAHSTRATSYVLIQPSGGYVGIGLTPSAWYASYDLVTEMNSGNGNFALSSISTKSIISRNAYQSDATTWKYKATGYAAKYEQSLGSHNFYGAISGTGGNSITFLDLLSLSPSTGITVNGSKNLTSGLFSVHGKTISDLFKIDFDTELSTFAGKILYKEAKWTGGNVIYVPLTGDIQTYINAATAGDTLILACGTYTITSKITIDKQLNIEGMGSAGFATVPVTASHGTLIKSTTSLLYGAFHIISDNVRLAYFSINLTGNASIGINIGDSNNAITDLQGIVLNSIDAVVNCAGYAQGFTIYGCDVIMRDLTFYVTSTNSLASGLWFWNDTGVAQNRSIDCYNVTGTCIGKSGSTFSIAFICENYEGTKTVTMNLSNSICRAYGGTNMDVAIASISTTTNNAIVNAYMCNLDGLDYDVYQNGTNTLNVGGSVLFNIKTFGTITYRAGLAAGVGLFGGTLKLETGNITELTDTININAATLTKIKSLMMQTIGAGTTWNEVRNTLYPGISKNDVIGGYRVYGCDNDSDIDNLFEIAVIHNKLPEYEADLEPRVEFRLFDYGIGTTSKLTITNHGIITMPGYGAGVLHFDANGLISSSAIVNDNLGAIVTAGTIPKGATTGFTDSIITESSGKIGINGTPLSTLFIKPASNIASYVASYTTYNQYVGLIIQRNETEGSYNVQWFQYVPPSTKNFILRCDSSDLLTIGITGNIGLKCTPSPWYALMSNVIESDCGVAGNYSIASILGTTDLLKNAYQYDATTWKFKGDGASSRIAQLTNGFYFYSAAAGSAGDSITWLQMLSMFPGDGIKFNSGHQLTSGLFSVSGKTTAGLLSIDLDTEVTNIVKTFVIGTLATPGSIQFEINAAGSGAKGQRIVNTNTGGRTILAFNEDATADVTNSWIQKYGSTHATHPFKMEIWNAHNGGLRIGVNNILRFDMANSGILTLSAYGTGIAHFSSAGVISSSAVVNGDLGALVTTGTIAKGATTGLTDSILKESNKVIGLNITPSPWHESMLGVLELGSTSYGNFSFASFNGNGEILNNAYQYDAAIFKYKAATDATRFQSYGGGFVFYGAAAGVNPGDNITWINMVQMFPGIGVFVNYTSQLKIGLFSISGKTTPDLFNVNFDTELTTIEKILLCNNNVGIGTTTFGTSGKGILGIANNTVPTTHVDNAIQIYSVDSNDSTATLGLFLEQAVVNSIATETHCVKIIINGHRYVLNLCDDEN